jgi:hypothetical protein
MAEILFPAGTDVVVTGDTHGLDHQLPDGTTGKVLSIAGREGKVRLVKWSTGSVWGRVAVGAARNVHVNDLALVEPETTTEEVEVIITALLPGDVVIRKADHPNYLAVRREVPAPPKPEPGLVSASWLIYADTRVVGLLDAHGVLHFLADDGQPMTTTEYGDVRPLTRPDPPALPSREALAKAIKGGNEPTPNPFSAAHDLVEVDPKLAADRVLALLKEARP